MRSCILLLSAGFLVAQQREPTPEDVQIMAAEWDRIAAPGQILRTDAHVLLLADPFDFIKIDNAKRIGDAEGISAELVARNRAIRLDEETEVRLLETSNVFCIGSSRPCPQGREQIADMYREYQTPVKQLAKQLAVTEAQAQQQHDVRRKRLIDHDLSAEIKYGYALVRVVDRPEVKGYVRMTELQGREAEKR